MKKCHPELTSVTLYVGEGQEGPMYLTNFFNLFFSKKEEKNGKITYIYIYIYSIPIIN